MTSLSPTPDFSSRNMQCEKVQPIYKIIIPQEEPKFSEDEFEMQSRIINKVWDEEPKQETLEEAAKERYGSHQFLYAQQREGFIEGAKWQSEQDNKKYSEEKVIDILYSFHKEENSRVVFSLSGITKWFEQFKKK